MGNNGTNYANTQLPVGERSLITIALTKLCGAPIYWIPIKNGFRFDGIATNIEIFVFYF